MPHCGLESRSAEPNKPLASSRRKEAPQALLAKRQPVVQRAGAVARSSRSK